MAEFTDVQQREIARIAQETLVSALADKSVLKDTGSKLVGAGLPVLSRVEKWLANLWSVASIVVALPLAYMGLEALADQRIKKELEATVNEKLDAEGGPLKSRLQQFTAFRGNLSQQLANNVDSATTKLLRFGCNPGPSGDAGDGFPACAPSSSDPANGTAQAVLETHNQMLHFKADPSKQRVLLRLGLMRIDDIEKLKLVALRLESPPLLATGSGSKLLELKPTDLPDTHEFLTPAGQIKLYGAVAQRGDQEPLEVEIDLTRHLRTKADLHALRFRAEPLAGAQARGSERFFLQATVVVTHSLPKD